MGMVKEFKGLKGKWHNYLRDNYNFMHEEQYPDHNRTLDVYIVVILCHYVIYRMCNEQGTQLFCRRNLTQPPISTMLQWSIEYKIQQTNVNILPNKCEIRITQ